MRLPSLVSLLALALLGACAAPAAAPRANRHTFVFLRTGPEAGRLTTEQRQELQRGHMANIGRLAEERALYVAGPFGKPNPEPELRGLFILATDDVDEARVVVSSDPSVGAGLLAAECVPLETPNDLRGALERDFAYADKLESNPSLDKQSAMASYWLVFADDAERAERALAPLASEGRLVLRGRFGGTRAGEGLYVLSLKDTTGEALEAWLDAAGSHRSIPWWASSQLP
jgi:uncharacterized protein YciI